MTEAKSSAGPAGGEGALVKMEYSQISGPGTYVMHRTGLLIRVPPNGVGEGHSPLVGLSGKSPVWVSQISDDPWLAVNRARSIAANHDMWVNF